jgi:hypothetical protein
MRHQTIVAWLHALEGMLVIACVATFWFAAAQLAPYFKGSFVPGLVALVGRPVAILLIACAGLEILAAAAMPRGHGWAKVLLLLFSVLQMAVFPIGTAIAVYTFWALLGPPAQAAQAAGRPAAPPTASDTP